MNETIPFRTEPERAAAMPRVVAHLRADGLIGYPTETVYGFGSLLRPTALARLAALKHRPPDKPFLLLVRTRADVPGLRWTAEAERLADAFWPGPLTLALDAPSSHLPEEVIGPEGTAAVRATPHDGVRALLNALDAPITSTSANAPGQPPASDAAGVLAALEVLGGDGVLVLDGGTLPASAPSTLVSCASAPPRLIRAGAIATAELQSVSPGIDG